MPGPEYGRILLKLSGEVLAGKQEFVIDPLMVSQQQQSHKFQNHI